MKYNHHLFATRDLIRVRDVELRVTDTSQEHREKLARIVLDEMFQFVGLLDAGGTLLEVNRAALEGAGIRLEDIRGKPFWEARWWQVSRETVRQLKGAIDRCASVGEFVRYDVEVFGRAGGDETIIIDFSLVPVRGADGAVAFLLAEGRDITEKKRAEAEIARKNQELQALLAKVRELDEIKSQLFANVSHELRTPLALILGPTERMLATTLEERQRRDLETVRRNAGMLLKRVNDLLDVAKLDAHQMTLAYQEADLAQLARAVGGHFEALAEERQVSFAVHAPAPVPAQVDPAKVERILLNLLSNAFKFTPSGGRIALKVGATGSGRALIEVQDTGPGVPPSQRELVFERFRQGDGGSTRHFGGTGLGLSIVREFVALHGGVVAVTEPAGGGALFQLELPLAAPEDALVRAPTHPSHDDHAFTGTLLELQTASPAPTPLPPPSESDEERAKVLVVEDNLELARFITEVLSADYAVAHAADGEYALAALQGGSFDVVVTDLMMPRMSGDQLVTAMRADPLLSCIPVLVLSAKSDDALRSRLLRAGAQDYVTKPFSAEELAARVRNLASVKRTRDLLQGELASQDSDLEQLAREVASSRRAMADANRAIAVARDAALAASAVKSRMLSLVSHEVRSPLMSLGLQAAVLRRLGLAHSRPEAARALDSLDRGVSRLGELFSMLLERARMEGGEVLPELSEVDLCALAWEVVEEVAPKASRHGLSIDCSCPADPVLLHTDRRALRLVIANLADNAIKYTKVGTVAVAVRAEDDCAVLQVVDSGIGVAAADLDCIFEPFVQLESIDNKHSPGLGLGLAIVRDLVTALGGKIQVRSRPDQGSTFEVRLQYGLVETPA